MTKLLIKEINDCLECPKLFKCSASNKLTASQKFAMKTSSACKGILKACPLPTKEEIQRTK